MPSFIILLSSSAITPANGLKAIQFAESALAQGHTIHSIFFSGDGISHANSLLQVVSDETDIKLHWQQFAAQHEIPLINCTTAASRRGVLSDVEASELGLSANQSDLFHAGGLVELVAGITKSHRLVRF
ncbi:sulfurtransferase complex subunit TusD [Shewanella avicenniae]|uniref:Sulfurtransferase complex subunit TusD n=1 Tax=Shewanella avicenniae TaxID=2814294 RepID=A0ABX7QVJ4_9GAMM|nr:sulfurtransferase complex subunit TusD [Shewanella avicenniae]QSX35284.1 sulfurtransferase complex subunit TusD [Shewanella avicenniae]